MAKVIAVLWETVPVRMEGGGHTGACKSKYSVTFTALAKVTIAVS